MNDLHSALMNSPGHRANILNPNFELIGIGIEVGDTRGFDAVYVTQKFATTSAPVQLDTGVEEPAVPALIVGTQGDDRLDGEAAADRIRAQAGDDRLNGGGGHDTMYGGAGADTLNSGDGHDRVYGGSQNDTLNGGAGNDLLGGGQGADVISGGLGADTLIGWGGNDTLRGDAGADVFVFSTGRDVVTDFDPGRVGEQIYMSNAQGIGSFRDLLEDGHMRQAGSNVVIADANGHRMILSGTDLSELSANDFVF